jgi:D-amino peptidase
MIRSDIEGVTGITTYEEAEKGEIGKRMLMNDLSACIEGILSTGDHEIVIYDEHTDGRNIQIDDLPANVSIICGKPQYRSDWGGIDTSFDIMMMIGFHARSGTEGALLPHSYSRKNLDIRVNNIPVGEIGMEAMIAGDVGVPLVLVTGDSAGMKEAEKLIPTIHTVSVKEALGEFEALCYSPKKTYKLIYVAAAEAVKRAGVRQPHVMRVSAPVELTVEIAETEFLDELRKAFPHYFVHDNLISIQGSSVTEVWSLYCQAERHVKKSHEG